MDNLPYKEVVGGQASIIKSQFYNKTALISKQVRNKFNFTFQRIRPT